MTTDSQIAGKPIESGQMQKQQTGTFLTTTLDSKDYVLYAEGVDGSNGGNDTVLARRHSLRMERHVNNRREYQWILKPTVADQRASPSRPMDGQPLRDRELGVPTDPLLDRLELGLYCRHGQRGWLRLLRDADERRLPNLVDFRIIFPWR